MICPQCHSGLDLRTDRDQPVHQCPKCGGTWVGGRSLHSMLQELNDSAGIEEVLDSILDLDFRESRRKCPNCAPRHLKVVVIEDTELDYCSRCKGLFFDPGELERVLPAGAVESRRFGGRDRGGEPEGFWSSLLRMLGDR